jgi:CheY-like chemotaxis protein
MSEKKKIILFIDDDKHLARIIRDFLIHEQFDVHTAASAEEGLDVLRTLEPDAVVLDINMPGMGGIGFLKRISNADGSLKHPVLVLTARAAMKDFFDTVAVDGFLPKPCSELDLIRKIRDIIADHDQRKLAEKERAEPPPVPVQRRVVLGEDDKVMSDLYVPMFKGCGFEVELACTGPEVLEKSVSSRPDAIVMKEMLPNMNGTLVARLIKTMPNTRHIPVIVHDESRTSKPAGDNAQFVSTYLFSSMPHDLIAAVRKVLTP